VRYRGGQEGCRVDLRESRHITSTHPSGTTLGCHTGQEMDFFLSSFGIEYVKKRMLGEGC
jgi:hypothetical protein